MGCVWSLVRVQSSRLFLLEKITTPQKTLVSKTELIPLLLKKRPQLLLAVGAGDIGAEIAHIKEAMKK